MVKEELEGSLCFQNEKEVLVYAARLGWAPKKLVQQQVLQGINTATKVSKGKLNNEGYQPLEFFKKGKKK